ncbi:helix-turn-helix domain-containing protein [Qipengyuania gaetbuli]|uniref:helix-turn-helix domain-containing protein n=1 Tax=Qipengyuania gaetbuli TaxID=266952 RepID=UPI001CD46B67|nr:helix-turn-helix domain-containing protein [Qipengyuania gaetbuli]MCA0911001.1 helix-turn-helix domain-containing protein [Qipengyuania gaetbuli]
MADKFRRAKVPRHVRVYHRQMQSDAWRHLSGSGVKVLLALAALEKGDNNGEFFLSARKGAEITGLGKNAVNRALHELQDKGFIYCAKRGGFSRKTPHAACWGLTWQGGPKGSEHRAPSHAYEKWRPAKKCGPQTADNTVPEIRSVRQNPPHNCPPNGDNKTRELAENRQSSAVRKSGTHNSYQGLPPDHATKSATVISPTFWWNPHPTRSLIPLIYAVTLAALLDDAINKRIAA